MMYETRHSNLRTPKEMCDVVISNLYKESHWDLNSSAFNHVTRNNQTFKIIQNISRPFHVRDMLSKGELHSNIVNSRQIQVHTPRKNNKDNQ